MARWQALTIGGLGGVGCAFAIVAMVLFALSDGTSEVMVALPMLTLGVFGALILLKQSNNAIGRLLFGSGLLLSFAAIGDAYAIYSAHERKLPYEEWGWWIAHWMFTAGFATVILGVLLLFPTGRLVSSRWRPVAAVIVGTFTVFICGTAFEPGLIGPDDIPPTQNPAAIEVLEEIQPFTAPVVLVAVFLSLFASVVMAITRVKRSTGRERQQLKWLALMVVVTLSLHVVAEVMRGDRGEVSLLSEALSDLAYLLLVIGLPAAIAVAILRHDLYDIDRLINRTIVYLMMTASLVLVYLALIFALGGMVRAFTNRRLDIDGRRVVSPHAVALPADR